MTASAPLRCASCGHRFGRRASAVLVFLDFALCQPCATSREAHARVFRGCARPGCIPVDHSGATVTIGVARQTLALIRLEGK